MRTEPGILRYLDFFQQGKTDHGGCFLRAFSLYGQQSLTVSPVAEQRP
jgi:hypothetical protein